MDDRKTDPATHDASYMGGTDAPDANTNLDSHVAGGPQTAADREATQDVTEQHAQGGLPAGLAQTPDPTRQNDNSGLLQPHMTPTDERADGADIIGQSGNDRNDA